MRKVFTRATILAVVAIAAPGPWSSSPASKAWIESSMRFSVGFEDWKTHTLKLFTEAA
jgi:hypothetical protein